MDSDLSLDGLLRLQPFPQMVLFPKNGLQHPSYLFVLLHGPCEKFGCANIATQACIACQNSTQGTKQNLVVVVQIFDHRQLVWVQSRTLVEAGASQKLRHRTERVAAKRANALRDLVDQLIEPGVLVPE